ncbi:MAG: ClpXP protease specificity-enhancing factor [Oxalobacter sp.]|nr:MAG: ClpXP protease specificity-enhancing factor [Oxalobacter sp.]
MSEISTKPYLMRAIYEWCTDNGYTPYLAVMVDHSTQVPLQFVRDGQIVLNISQGATKGLKMDNESIRFGARFGGVAREVYVPVENVIAIYASENGQGMAFEAPDLSTKKTASSKEPPPTLHSVPTETRAVSDESDDTPDPPKGGKPTLTRIK